MSYTSAQLNKELRKLNEEKESLLEQEMKSSVFNCAVGEKEDNIRPEYDFMDMQKKIDDIDAKIMHIKHIINTFNLKTEVADTGLTIDQVLIRIPQLTARKRKLTGMANRLKRERVDNVYSRNNIIDYVIANYDIEEVKEELKSVSEELTELQTALDIVNNTVEIE